MQIDKRFIEIIPGIEKMKDGHCDQSGTGLWKNYIHKNLKGRSPIDLSGIIQLKRDSHKKLSQQEDIIGIREELGNNQRQEGIHPAQFVEEYIGWQQTYLTG